MAHHNNTPESVLTAPSQTEDWLVWHRAPSRAMRRHPSRFPKIFAGSEKAISTVNKPYEKGEK